MYVYVLEVRLSVAIKLGKEGKFFEKAEGPNPAGNPASSWPDCCAVLKKKMVVATALYPARNPAGL